MDNRLTEGENSGRRPTSSGQEYPLESTAIALVFYMLGRKPRRRGDSDSLTGGGKGIPGKANEGARMGSGLAGTRWARCSRGPMLEPAGRMGTGGAGAGGERLSARGLWGSGM